MRLVINPHIICCIGSSSVLFLCFPSVDLCFKLLTEVLIFSHQPLFSLLCHPIPSVPNSLHSSVCSPHLRLAASQLSFFFFKKVCESAITETPSFSAQAAKFILVVFHMFILGFLEGRHICGKTKRPGAGAFPLGIIAARVKIGKSFLGKWN